MRCWYTILKSLSSTGLDDRFLFEVDLQQLKCTCLSLKLATKSQFLSAAYHGKWYIGIIKEADFSNGEFLLDLIHPNGPLSSFQ